MVCGLICRNEHDSGQLLRTLTAQVLGVSLYAPTQPTPASVWSFASLEQKRHFGSLAS
jgi:hypothetical protein